MILPDVTRAIGDTPLVALDRLSKGLSGRLLAKLEMRNPGGSVKDRVALRLIEDAERRGLIVPGATLIEATAGNTGIGLATVAAVRGYRLILVMPEAMSEERARLLRHMGVDVRLSPGILVRDSVAMVRALHAQLPGSFLVDQFNNASNVAVHRETTAEEIWADTGGSVDAFVATVGTGGTLMGVASILKQRQPSCRIVAVEPAESSVLSGGAVGQHSIPGIGVGFVPPLFDRTLVDEVIPVRSTDAFATARRLAKCEGISAGISSGAAVHASLVLMDRPEMAEKTVVTILPDSGDRYASSGLFEA
jgi:cysteine synthase A